MFIKNFATTYRRILLALNEILKPYGLNTSDWRVFSYLSTHIKAPPNQIAAAYEMDRASMSRVISKLEKMQLISTAKSSDKREKLITLSPEGVQLHYELNAKIKNFSSEILVGIDGLKEAEFLKTLDDINKNLDKFGEKNGTNQKI